MRLQYQLPDWWAGTLVMTNRTCCVLNRVLMNPNMIATSKRDIALRIFQDYSAGLEAYIAVFRSVEEALEATCAIPFIPEHEPKEVIAWGAWAPVGDRTLFSLLNVDANKPDVTGLGVDVNGYGGAIGAPYNTRWDFVVTYDSSPALIAEHAMETILEQYTGEGEALEGFSTGDIKTQRKGQSGRGRGIIVATAGDEEMGGEGNGAFDRDCHILLQVGYRSAKDDRARQKAKKYADAIVSILADERPTLDGACHKVHVRSVSEPVEIEEGNEAYMVVEIATVVQIRGALYSDYIP